MRSLFSRFAKPSRHRGVRRREVFSAQFDGGQSAAAYGTSTPLGCDVLERRIVLTSSLGSDFEFAQGVITGYTGAGGVVDIPSTIGGVPVAVIGLGAFQNNSTITSLVIPDSVTLIYDKAFQGMSSLESAKIGNGVTYVGVNAFYNASKLATVSIGSRVTTIVNDAFYGTALTTVTIPSSVTYLGKRAFFNIAPLTSVTIANAKVEIDTSVFADSDPSTPSKLATVTLGNGVKSIGVNAFAGAALTAVTIPRTVTSIGDGAFRNNANLKSVTFTAKAPTVGVDAFKGVPFGAKAIRAAGLTGYGPNGTLWNNLIVWTPGAVAAPTVTVSTANLAYGASTMTIKGTGFVAGKPSAHQVTFNNGAEGMVMSATDTKLTVMLMKQPNSTGPLTAIVTSVGGTSGVAKRVATVV